MLYYWWLEWLVLRMRKLQKHAQVFIQAGVPDAIVVLQLIYSELRIALKRYFKERVCNTLLPHNIDICLYHYKDQWIYQR